jgi:RNA polymerase sigma-70 factor (ECF subfamily)
MRRLDNWYGEGGGYGGLEARGHGPAVTVRLRALAAIALRGLTRLARLRSDGIQQAAERLGAGGARSATERQAFEQFFSRYQLPLLDYLYGMTRDHAVAEDLVQETFLRAYEATTAVAQLPHPQAWLYRIATNIALDTLRRQRRFHWLPLSHVEPEAGASGTAPWAASPPPAMRREDISASVAERDAVWGVLAELPPRWRAVLLLQTAAGFSVRDIAKLLHLEEGNIRKMLYRAKERFRAIYAELEAAEAGKTMGHRP